MPADVTLTSAQVEATALSIIRQQYPSGAIPWYASFDGYPAGKVDAWNHVEAAMALSASGFGAEARRAYGWLRDEQRPDGSWPAKWEDEKVTDTGGESNHAAYIAVGMWHELLVTGDEEYVASLWPVVRAAVDFVVDLQTPLGDIKWIRWEDGSVGEDSLLTGCSSIYQALRCAVALADRMAEPRPDWELAADRLGHVIAHHPEAFADKSRWSMDWYYPVLGGAVRGPAADELIASGWSTYMADGLGCRCVSDQPWVTGAETCELVLALDAIGDPRAYDVFRDIQFLRHHDGSYWTGWQFEHQRHFPGDRSTYTAAAVLLANDSLTNKTPASRIFKEVAGRPLAPSPTPAPPTCNCPLPAHT